MVNTTTATFRRLMLSGHMNQRINEGVQKGIAATKAAKETQAARCAASDMPIQEPQNHADDKGKTGAARRAQGV